MRPASLVPFVAGVVVSAISLVILLFSARSSKSDGPGVLLAELFILVLGSALAGAQAGRRRDAIMFPLGASLATFFAILLCATTDPDSIDWFMAILAALVSSVPVALVGSVVGVAAYVLFVYLPARRAVSDCRCACGYSRIGLPVGASCPECGSPPRVDLPDRG